MSAKSTLGIKYACKCCNQTSDNRATNWSLHNPQRKRHKEEKTLCRYCTSVRKFFVEHILHNMKRVGGSINMMKVQSEPAVGLCYRTVVLGCTRYSIITAHGNEWRKRSTEKMPERKEQAREENIIKDHNVLK